MPLKLKPVTPTLKLPVQKTVPASDLGAFTMLLYGREKIGKTSLLSQFEDALFLMMEPGAKALSVYAVDVHTWDDFIQYVKLLETEKKRFKTVVVDPVDLLYKLCEQATCKKLGISHPSEEEWGKGWNAVRDEFTKWVVRLCHAGRGVVFVSHDTEKEIKRRSGASTTRVVPTMAGMARGVIEGLVDIWAYMDYDDDGTTRTLRIRGDDLISAGHRLQDNFIGVEKIPMGLTAAEGYRNFRAAFSNQGIAKGGASTKKIVRKAV